MKVKILTIFIFLGTLFFAQKTQDNVIQETPIELAPVIAKGKYERKNLSIKQKKKTNSRLISTVGSEYALKIDNPTNNSGKINNVILHLHKTMKDVNLTTLEINFYRGDTLTGLPLEKLNRDLITFRPKNKGRGKNTVDVKDKNIIFPKNGVFVSVKFLPNEFGDKKVGPSLRLKLSDEILTYHNVSSSGNWSQFGVWGNSRTYSNIMMGLDVWVRK